MRTLYLDCGMGAAGDMLTAALYELLSEAEQKTFINDMNSLGLDGVHIGPEPMTKCGIVGTHMNVMIHGEEEHEHDHHHEHNHHHDHEHERHHEHDHHHEHEHHHEHDHHHDHEHHHSSMADIEHIIGNMPLPAKAKEDAIAVYKLIAEAESHAHGRPVTEIHFHEVGTLDAIADVTAVCYLIEKLGVQRIIASPVHVGSGHVHCAHGILPVPAPATAFILKDVPIYGGEIDGELCTPTGAAILKHFADEFGQMPVIRTQAIGYGMGKKEFSRANCVRAIIGETEASSDQVIELTCNVDDMTPERIGFATETLLEAGALEVYTISVGMKKSRPGVMICVMCRENIKDEIIHLIFKHTTTIGIRENVSRRYTLSRRMETIQTELGDVRVKHSEGYGVLREKYEYEDLARIARKNNISISDVAKSLEESARKA